MEDSDLDLLDRKMPALVVPVAQTCGNNVGNSSRMNHSNVGSTSTDVLSSASADQIKDKEEDKEDDSRWGANENVSQTVMAPKHWEWVGEGHMPLHCEGDSLSLINGKMEYRGWDRIVNFSVAK